MADIATIPVKLAEQDETYRVAVTTEEIETVRMDEEIRIMPIPSNYGLITWDGSVLLVS